MHRKLDYLPNLLGPAASMKRSCGESSCVHRMRGPSMRTNSPFETMSLGKFWIFHGRVQFIQVDFARFSNHSRTFYDRQWKRQIWTMGYPAGPDLSRPWTPGRMIDIAQNLAVDRKFVRVDLYNVNLRSCVLVN